MVAFVKVAGMLTPNLVKFFLLSSVFLPSLWAHSLLGTCRITESMAVLVSNSHGVTEYLLVHLTTRVYSIVVKCGCAEEGVHTGDGYDRLFSCLLFLSHTHTQTKPPRSTLFPALLPTVQLWPLMWTSLLAHELTSCVSWQSMPAIQLRGSSCSRSPLPRMKAK